MLRNIVSETVLHNKSFACERKCCATILLRINVSRNRTQPRIIQHFMNPALWLVSVLDDDVNEWKWQTCGMTTMSICLFQCMKTVKSLWDPTNSDYKNKIHKHLEQEIAIALGKPGTYVTESRFLSCLCTPIGLYCRIVLPWPLQRVACLGLPTLSWLRPLPSLPSPSPLSLPSLSPAPFIPPSPSLRSKPP